MSSSSSSASSTNASSTNASASNSSSNINPTLSRLIGTWKGAGFNTIFRPDNRITPTPFQNSPTEADQFNTLMLSVTTEELTFGPKLLAGIPNRGFESQPNINLSGLPYTQTIRDITGDNKQEIHFETGMWMHVPPTAHPPQEETFVRMGSIPHGTTILAQGGKNTKASAPEIPPISITPINQKDHSLVDFPSLHADNTNSRRLPQVLPPSITAKMLEDPNSLLRAHIEMQKPSHTILHNDVIDVDTEHHEGRLGGGNANIDFLAGAKTEKPNANTTRMTFKLWLETVEVVVPVAPGKAGERIVVPFNSKVAHLPDVKFRVVYVKDVTHAVHHKAHYTQLQYSQNVSLRFNGLIWPHVSVATLVPDAEIEISVP